jgi:PAS domain S-box-containing protein
LCAWSPDGQILAVNRQALAMLGCQGDELAGRTPGSVPVNPDEFAGVHREALARDGAVTREFGVGRDDGPRRWVRLTARALRNGEGVARFVLARCDDVTEDRQQLAALQAALAEREVLLREVHHRVKNNLQIISSLLNLRLQTPSDPAARDLLRESQLRIKAIALVHQRLYSSASFARIDLEDYVCSLVANVRDAYAPLNPPVEVSLDVARVSVCMEHGIRLGLILTELVANAFKHAFVGRRAGCVRIGIRPVDDQRLEARVEDDGVGLPEDLARRSANSLGLALVRNFVEQLRGGLSFESQPGAGTRFRFVFLRERSDHSGGPA